MTSPDCAGERRGRRTGSTRPRPAHWWMAAAACATLHAAGWPVSSMPQPPCARRVPGPREELSWGVRHGVPWLATHLTRLGPLVTSMRRHGHFSRPHAGTVIGVPSPPGGCARVSDRRRRRQKLT